MRYIRLNLSVMGIAIALLILVIITLAKSMFSDYEITITTNDYHEFLPEFITMIVLLIISLYTAYRYIKVEGHNHRK